MLSTKRHEGKHLYVCRECDNFSTNSAKEIQNHLMAVHASKFSTAADASEYIMAGIYQRQR